MRSPLISRFLPSSYKWLQYSLVAVFTVFSLMTLPAQPVMAEGVLFAHSTSLYEANRYSKRIKVSKAGETQPLDVWIKRAILDREKSPFAARRHYEAALSLQPKRPTLWLQLSKTIQAIVVAQKKSRSLHAYYRDGGAAAFNAYRFSTVKQEKADALAQLAYFLRARSYWRPSLNAYKASLELADNKDIRLVYNELRAEKGFRITNYKINSDLRQPRLCIQFSETLYSRGTDYSTFFKINNQDPAGVRVERRQICVDGFKHGETYKIAVRQGLPSVVGEQLLKTSDITVYVRDRSPSVRFSSKAYVLPKFGQRGLPLMSVNAERADIRVYRVGDRNLLSTVMDGQFRNNLNEYETEELSNKFGAQVYKGTVDIKTKLNEDIKTAVPVHTALPDMKPGLYVIRAWPSNSKYGSNKGSTQWFIVSDLGLTTLKAQNGLYGFVRSITKASPLSGVSVKLLAHNNEILGTASSDDKGMIKFAAGLLRGTGGNRPALLVAESGTGDYGFVDLTKSAFDLTDRGVSGRSSPGPLDGFIFAERGVYRPGEDVQLTALLRDQLGNGVLGVPLTLIISRPDGKEHRSVTLPDQGAGGRSYSLPLIQTAMTGTWRVSMYGDVKADPVGSTSFLVEDYVPERMTLSLKKETETWSQNSKAEIRVTGEYLYGAAASKHQIKGDYTIRKRSSGLKGYEGFQFGLVDEKFLNIHNTLNNIGLLNEKGKSTLLLDLPDFQRPSKPIEATINVRLLEPGGRQVVRAVTFPVANERPMIGIKKVLSSSQMKEQKRAVFDIVRLNKRTRQEAEVLKWELVEITKDYQWYNQNGNWRFEPVVYTNKVASGEVNTLEDGFARIEMPVGRGQFHLEVVSHTFNQLAASAKFNVDWWGAKDADTPDVLELASDKARYNVGDKLVLRLKPRANGRAFVAVMNETVLDMKEVALGASGGEVIFEVKDSWGVGAYAVAMHYHTQDETLGQMPGRAIGVKWIKIDEAPRTLSVNLKLPEHHEANKDLTLPIEITGLTSGEDAYVTVSAVDEGILTLTNYLSPKPASHFYGQRRLATEIRDIYGHLIDGLGGSLGRIRSGGDAGGQALQGAPNSIKPVALYSGIVKVSEDGKANITFEVPQFNGSLRVMTVAWSKTKLGSSSQNLVVRDPVVVLASMPLFLTKGDQSRLFLSIDNVDGPDGTYYLKAEAGSGLLFDATQMKEPLQLKKGMRVNVSLSMTAKTIGLNQIKLSLIHTNKDPNRPSIALSQTHDMYIKPPQPNASWRTVKKLEANGGKLSFSKDIFADIIPESARATLSIGHLAGLNVPGLFEGLDRYPYGCAEQTTSKAMPLLYASKIAPHYGRTIAKDLPKIIEKAVARLAALQNTQGGFGLWSPHYADMWLTAYVTDFLTRASEQKFKIDPEMISSALQRLKNTVNFASDFKKGGQDIAYAMYVLARNGEANIGDLRYYADTKIKNFATPIAQAQVAASLAMYGDTDRAQKAFKVAYQTMKSLPLAEGTSGYRDDFGTRLRDRAALLALSSEAKQSSLPKLELINAVVEARAQKTYTSTQEKAWMLLAANALEDNDKSMLLEVNGVDTKGLYAKSFTPKDVATGDLTIVNKSAEVVNAVLTIHGSAENPLPASEKDIGLKRQFFTFSGKEVSLINAKQNDRVVVVLTISDHQHRGGRLMLTDHIPAGFIIENPKLVTGGSLRNLAWLKPRVWPVHQSFKDDKFSAAFDVSTRRSDTSTRIIQVAYIMRAAHDGRYLHPAAHVEDMYRPSRFARTDAQHVIVSKP